ncbi:hypothetical protein FKM82_008216 [Ascaphus truei]
MSPIPILTLTWLPRGVVNGLERAGNHCSGARGRILDGGGLAEIIGLGLILVSGGALGVEVGSGLESNIWSNSA